MQLGVAKCSNDTERRLMSPGCLLPAQDAGRGAAVPNVLFRTVRPADYAAPYDAMLKHGVQVTVVEKQQSVFTTIGVRRAAAFACSCLPAAVRGPSPWRRRCCCRLTGLHGRTLLCRLRPRPQRRR